ncbi:universal stress protein [bacterium]|nr:universal stress protein [bacterium]
MKILIAISSKEFSKPTLQVGMWVAKAFNASVTIVYVGQKISSFYTSNVGLAQESIAKWGLDRPGVKVLEWAFNYLADHKYFTSETVEAGFDRNTLIDRGRNRLELFLKSTYCKDVKLILRRGDIIPELRNEVMQEGYDITIIGGSKKRRMAHDLVQYIDSSIFVVNNFLEHQGYRLLQAVDDSKGTAVAIKYGSQFAKAFKFPVDVLTVSKRDTFGSGYMGAHKNAMRAFEKVGIKPVSMLKVGDPVKTVLDTATKNHLIVMGVSHLNPIIQYFKGSKPLKVMKQCSCPIIIVK